MKYVRKILRRYFFCLTVILCAGFLLGGIVTAAQRTRYNAQLEEYIIVSAENEKDFIRLKAGEKEFIIKKLWENQELKDLAQTFVRYFD